MSRPRLRRSRWLPPTVAAALAVTATGCAPAVEPRTSVGFGFEDVVGDADWDAIDERLDAASVDAVTIGVGRVDWLAFVPETAGSPSAIAEAADDDLLAAAIEAIATDADGEPRHVTLVLDAYMPLRIADDPRLGALGVDDERSELSASAWGLEGVATDELAAVAAELAERYAPDAIALTELVLAESVSDDDLESFQERTGQDDWPRLDDGSIDVDADGVEAWRIDVLTDAVARVADAVHAAGAELAVDVSVDWDEPARGRPDLGQDYERLLEVADRLVLWAYAGLQDIDPARTGDLAPALADAGLDVRDLTVSVGLWRTDVGDVQPIEADVLADALATVRDVGEVHVTPAMLLDGTRWQTLQDAWS